MDNSEFKKNGVVVCIPARYDSSRFPGKVIAKLGGKPIIRWVYERAKQSFADDVIVATDSEKVAEVVKQFDGKCIMTKPDHPSGTDRIWEAVRNIGCEIIINVQGDEPLIDVTTINALIDKMESDSRIEMGTVAVKSTREKIAKNSDVVKVVVDKSNFALYFSRAEIPFPRVIDDNYPIYHHLGIYAYRKKTLEKIVALPQSIIERCEKLEQLRALDNGIKIFTLIIKEYNGIGIDTPQDLLNAEELIQKIKNS